ncbi:3-oxoacyl-ACP synthase (plasmid) [Rahnella aceris]|uniref:3-oxoacyl-ACP synthase n=1 Tax=Rahnella sp. (strain Y9602) TaxID=2703885 RepID=UPI001906F425|nr:3-oxoacyl-ACP synthase [Rahnella aceris]QQN37744.1 3-oxoacyl-ACP synthase [Rahnella aceris]
MNIFALKTCIPVTRISLDAILAHRGANPSEARTFRHLFGFQEASTLAEDESATATFESLLQQTAVQLTQAEKIDAIILVQGLPARSRRQRVDLALLRQRFDFIAPDAHLITLNQQNCATLFWGLLMAGRMLEQGKYQCVALLAGDTLADFSLAERYVPGCTLIGDAFACALLRPGGGERRVSGIHCFHHPAFWQGLDGSREDIKRFYQSHDALIDMALRQYPAEQRKDAWLLPHNINRLSWQTWRRHPDRAHQRIATDLIGQCGHCYTTDPLLLLDTHPPAETGQPAILLSVGLGGWVGSAMITSDTFAEPQDAR